MYKRQGLLCALIPYHSETGLSLQQFVLLVQLSPLVALYRAITVSYTHLDVYKRQVEGKIFDKGKELPIEKETGDRDTDRMVAISPKVRYRRKDVYKRQVLWCVQFLLW